MPLRPRGRDGALSFGYSNCFLNLANSDSNASSLRRNPWEVVETKGPEVMEQLIQYVSELMTPERFDQLHADVRSLLRDEPDLSPKEKYFLTLADVYLAEEDAVQNEIAFLTNALMGELKQYVMAASLEVE
jgi:hypothetical protein